MVKWRWKPILDKESDKEKKDSKDNIKNIMSKDIECLYILKFKLLYHLRDLERKMYQSISTVDICNNSLTIYNY